VGQSPEQTDLAIDLRHERSALSDVALGDGDAHRGLQLRRGTGGEPVGVRPIPAGTLRSFGQVQRHAARRPPQLVLQPTIELRHARAHLLQLPDDLQAQLQCDEHLCLLFQPATWNTA
jgi:hypothetical protein